MMNKKTARAFGKNVYLLGKDADGVYYWLEEGSFDCGWYWGFGYVEMYTDNKRPDWSEDIDSHQHFNGMFFNHNKNAYDAFKDFFADSVLTDDELWKLVELMKSFYIAREYADMLYCGGAHYTGNPAKDIIKNDDEYNRINKVVIPAIMQKVYKLLSK